MRSASPLFIIVEHWFVFCRK